MRFQAMLRGTLDLVLVGGFALGLAALTGCGSSGNGGGGGGTTPSNGAKNVYVIENSENSGSTVLEFAAGAEGSVSPKATLILPGDYIAVSVATDSTGQIYVGGLSTPNFEVLVYPANSTGAATPTRTILLGEFTDPQGLFPNSLTVDSTGKLYIASESGFLAVYSATANGAATPLQLIASSLLTEPLGVAIDSAGNMYVSNALLTQNVSTGTIYVYAVGSTGNATPLRTITTPNFFLGIALDSSGNIYATETAIVLDGEGDPISSTSQIVEFASSATGAATPTKTISIPAGSSPIVLAAGLRIDSVGDVFTVAQTATSNGTVVANTLLEYGPGASGSATPITSLTSSSWPNAGEELALN